MEANEIMKTPMQELMLTLLETRDFLNQKQEFNDLASEDISIKLTTLNKIINNSFVIEEITLSHAFNYGYLQAMLGNDSELKNGNEYVKKFYKKNENISS